MAGAVIYEARSSMCRRCHLCIAPATAHSGRRAAANPEVITTNTSDKIIARTTDSGLRPSAGPGMTAADCGTGVIYGQRRHLCACDVIYAWPQPRYHSGVRASTDPRMTGCGSRNARHLWTEPSLPQPRRRSGTPRSGEPGTHNHESLGSNHDRSVWIPGSGLRPAPE